MGIAISITTYDSSQLALYTSYLLKFDIIWIANYMSVCTV